MANKTNKTVDPNAVAQSAADLTKQAATKPEEREAHLKPARELKDFSMPNRADVRGWPVFASDARMVGMIDRLLVEPSTMKIRYASVSLAHNAVEDGKPTVGGSVLVPVGVMRRLDDRNAIALDKLTSQQLASAPRVSQGPVTMADENATLTVYGMPTTKDANLGDLYTSPQFDDKHLLTTSK